MTQSEPLFFDASLSRLVTAVRGALGEANLSRGLAVRDASGRLSFVSPSSMASDERTLEVERQLKEALGDYARPDRVIAFADDVGADSLLADPSKLSFPVDATTVSLLDRRIVGTGWLETPDDAIATPPRLVFASIKGGVGRSSALVVTAADLARRGKNVLVIDLDLEAPGVGHLLLNQDRVPQFGVVDFLLESGIATIGDSLLSSFIGTSDLTSGTTGRVDVVPAFGMQSGCYPENVLPKLSRAMVEAVSAEGEVTSVARQLSEMVRRFSAQASYDAVLIDSRAGLAELTAPAVLNLGASVLLFGIAQRQTIEGYRALFSALKLLAVRDRAAGRPADWRRRLKAVYAKAAIGSTHAAMTAKRHHDDLYELFADNLYDAEEEPDSAALQKLIDYEPLNFGIDDPDAPHSSLQIPFNQSFADFDPLIVPDQLTQGFYEATFRLFLDGVDRILFGSAPSEPAGTE